MGSPNSLSAQLYDTGDQLVIDLTDGVSVAASNNITGKDGDSKLDLGETWTYTCTSTLTENTTNIATASANGEVSGASTSSTDNWTIIEQGGSQSCTSTSSDGRFTLTKASDVSYVPSGGGLVTYTYTIENISSQRQYYVSGSDDQCSPLSGGVSQMQSIEVGGVDRYYLDPGQSATWTCTQNITQTTTNEATFVFADDYSYNYVLLLLRWVFDWEGESSATCSLTVEREIPTGIPDCNTLWYSGDETSSYDGTLGTLTTTGVQDVYSDIQTQTGSSALEGSAAMAVDPFDPTQVYYIPRDETPTSSSGGLYVYDILTNTSTEISSAGDTPDVVRLGVDPNGLVWTIDSSGRAWSFDPNTGTWTDRGIIQLPSGFNWNDLGSGDLTFDGNGTMYFIASSSTAGQLFTVTQSELLDGSPSAQHVGQMGTGAQFNGIAFTEDGMLYATSSSSGTSYLYSVDIATGAATQISVLAQSAMDLGSCALPQANINLQKSNSKYLPSN